MRGRCTDKFFAPDTVRYFERRPNSPKGRREAYKGCIVVTHYQVCTGGFVAKHVTAYAFDSVANDTYYIGAYRNTADAKADIRSRLMS
jgi:hypothetical protein